MMAKKLMTKTRTPFIPWTCFRAMPTGTKTSMRLIQDAKTALNCAPIDGLGHFFFFDSPVSVRWSSVSSSPSSPCFLPMNGMYLRIFLFLGPPSVPTDRSVIPSCGASECSRAEPLELLSRRSSSFSLGVAMGSTASNVRGGMLPGGPGGNVPAFLVPPKLSASKSVGLCCSRGEDMVCANPPPSASGSVARRGMELMRPKKL